jgi:hypothetical protein
MVCRIGMIGLCLSMWMGFACSSTAWAKPADLPVPSKLECPDGADDPVQGNFSIKLDLLSGRVTVEVNQPMTQSSGAIDTVGPALLPALFEQLLKQTGEVVLMRGTAMGKDLEARRCFEQAERARAARNLEAARRGYQQAHLLAPTSLLGRLAIIRLQEIEDRIRDTTEESTDPAPLDPRSMFRDMNGRTVPLGLVVVSY